MNCPLYCSHIGARKHQQGKNHLIKLQAGIFWDLTNSCPKRDNPYWPIKGDTAFSDKEGKNKIWKRVCHKGLLLEDIQCFAIFPLSYHLKRTLIRNSLQ